MIHKSSKSISIHESMHNTREGGRHNLNALRNHFGSKNVVANSKVFDFFTRTKQKKYQTQCFIQQYNHDTIFRLPSRCTIQSLTRVLWYTSQVSHCLMFYNMWTLYLASMTVASVLDAWKISLPWSRTSHLGGSWEPGTRLTSWTSLKSVSLQLASCWQASTVSLTPSPSKSSWQASPTPSRSQSS